jgi:glucosamine kinase
VVERFFLGIAGDGTGCHARLVSADGTVLGLGVGGAVDLSRGPDHAWGAIIPAVEGALAAAGLGRAALAQSVAGLGLAGIASDTDALALVAASPVAFADIAVANLTHTACLGALAGRDGAILIAGDTDNAGYALLGGMVHQIGGWNFPHADDASAAALGRRVSAAVLRAVDGLAPHGGLTCRVLASLNDDPAALLAWLRRAGPADYVSLAAWALEMAMAGDGIAIALVAETVDHLTAQLRRLTELGAHDICLTGALGDVLRDWLPPWARRQLRQAQGDAIDGAILLILQKISRGLALADNEC